MFLHSDSLPFFVICNAIIHLSLSKESAPSLFFYCLAERVGNIQFTDEKNKQIGVSTDHDIFPNNETQPPL